MFASSIVLFTLHLGAIALAALHNDAVDSQVSKAHLDISKLITGLPIDGGKIDSVSIPHLDNFSLSRINESFVYQLPEDGIEISEELYKTLSGKKPKALEKRDCPLNPCKCGTSISWHLFEGNWNTFTGKSQVLSSALCGPGTVSTAFAHSYSLTVSGSLDPAFGITLDRIFLEKLGFRVGFAYTWGDAVTTSYTALCGEAHPCVATFSPYIGVVKGKGRWTELSNQGKKLCNSGIGGNLEMHLPVIRDCKDNVCGADGVWGHCYYLGAIAKNLCSNIGPPPEPACPASLYPSH